MLDLVQKILCTIGFFVPYTVRHVGARTRWVVAAQQDCYLKHESLHLLLHFMVAQATEQVNPLAWNGSLRIW